MGRIHNDKILIFKHEGLALKAASELDNKGYVDLILYESIAVVSFVNSYENADWGRSIKDLINECIEILKKYDVEYKCKILKF